MRAVSRTRIGSVPRVISSASARRRSRDWFSARWRSWRLRRGRRLAVVSRSPGRIPLARPAPRGRHGARGDPRAGVGRQLVGARARPARRRATSPSSGASAVVGSGPRACTGACPAADRAASRSLSVRPASSSCALARCSGATRLEQLPPAVCERDQGAAAVVRVGLALGEASLHEPVDPEAHRSRGETQLRCQAPLRDASRRRAEPAWPAPRSRRCADQSERTRSRASARARAWRRASRAVTAIGSTSRSGLVARQPAITLAIESSTQRRPLGAGRKDPARRGVMIEG